MNIFKRTDILVPQGVDLKKWSVVACDQYTSQPEYWNEVIKTVGASPSALNIIFPEIYLNDGNDEHRIEDINKTMQKYLQEGLFREFKNSLIMVERKQRNGKVRTGIVGAVDLEEYSFIKGEGTAIRATEGTVTERIPPRVRIRQNASLELPHILILIDDRERTVIEPLEAEKERFEKIYDFDCMMDSGHLTGRLIDGMAAERIMSALDKMYNREYFKNKYNTDSEDVLLFAVGDGNHSLATAKSCWNKLKESLTEEERKNHPARFALVEIMNIHDETLEFEPIHRVLFGVEPENVIEKFMATYPGTSHTDNGGQHIRYVYKGTSGDLYVKNPKSNLAVGTLQSFIDGYISDTGARVDYIHGDDVTKRLGEQSGNIGFLLPCPEKDELFKTIIADGVLPRKTFSMGEAEDKRFYLECKRIKK